MDERKMTKTMILQAIKEMIAPEDTNAVFATIDDVDILGSDIIDYAEKTIQQLATKASKAKALAARKKAKGDPLRDKVLDVMNENWMTLMQITELVNENIEDGEEEYSYSKLIPRLTALASAGTIEKAKAKVEKRILTVYRLPGDFDIEE